MGICGFKGARTVTLSQPEDSDSESKPAGGDRVLSSGGDDAIKKSVDAEPEPTPPVRNVGRRKSVFAEAYNPEDDADDQPAVVHPKSDSQRASLAEAVKHILLFRSLDGEQMQQVLDAMFERRVQAGDFVIKQGDDGDNFYVIESGKYKVYVKMDGEAEPKLVGGYDNAGSFGELALMYNMPRAATVQAENGGSLWAMDRQTFRRIVLKNAYKKRQMYESLLNSVPMLKTLENYERMNLADALVPRTYTDGDTIIKQGDAADGMYFMEDGEVRVVKIDGNGVEKEINRATKGGYFGELALLTNKPRAATIFAVGTVKTAFLDVEAFERLLGPCMELMKRNAEDYEQQLIRIFGSKSAITDIR
ncbi:cAMP-dependent protein kinase type II regulatory subunit isoform X2 [Folsomia candida]|uniref:cAMP-dependent protein kinase type II regulatory subunit isoform X2 n=1 Tax=Folsomia candida TaxID=158441 RepID=UPI001604A3ED|nr:cAMP-dependent protein kinase type II regulatory subunit isoform X2 [Folsomia candida]